MKKIGGVVLTIFLSILTIVPANHSFAKSDNSEVESVVSSFLKAQGETTYKNPSSFSSIYDYVTSDLADEVKSQRIGMEKYFSDNQISVSYKNINVSTLKRDGDSYIIEGKVTDTFTFEATGEKKESSLDRDFYVKNENGKYLIYSINEHDNTLSITKK